MNPPRQRDKREDLNIFFILYVDFLSTFLLSILFVSLRTWTLPIVLNTVADLSILYV